MTTEDSINEPCRPCFVGSYAPSPTNGNMTPITPTSENVEVSCTVPGVGPDAPTTTNAAGGKQSASLYRCDLLPAKAVLAVAAVLKYGADKYGPDNWRKIARADHLNHAMTHILAYQAGDRSDDHMSHAACRLLMALETKE